MAKDIIDINDIIRHFLRLYINTQMQVTAMRFALEDQGILTPDAKSSAMARAQEIWGPRLAAIEKSEPTEESLIRSILESFEGPIQ